MDALLPAYGSQTAARREERGWMFRGQSDPTWKLAPTLYREPFGPSDVADRRCKTDSFITALRSHAERFGLSNSTDDEFLAVAQHYGSPTAHIDFTFNIEVAAYFASSSNPANAEVGVIYCFNVEEYRQMCNPFAALGVSQEYAEEQMRAGGLNPLPPLRTVQLKNVPRILQQEAVFLEVHEDHIEALMHNCIERFHFKHSNGGSYTSGTQWKLWMLPDRSSFGSDFDYAGFLNVARRQRPELFEGTPYVGDDIIFPEDDDIRQFVDERK